jgi:hypothetical protein
MMAASAAVVCELKLELPPPLSVEVEAELLELVREVKIIGACPPSTGRCVEAVKTPVETGGSRSSQ